MRISSLLSVQIVSELSVYPIALSEPCIDPLPSFLSIPTDCKSSPLLSVEGDIASTGTSHRRGLVIGPVCASPIPIRSDGTLLKPQYLRTPLSALPLLDAFERLPVLLLGNILDFDGGEYDLYAIAINESASNSFLPILLISKNISVKSLVEALIRAVSFFFKRAAEMRNRTLLPSQKNISHTLKVTSGRNVFTNRHINQGTVTSESCS